MSFAPVFKALQELFPQVDHRILKAVSIEHHEDVNSAVEFILNEVVRSTCSPLDAPHDLIDGKDDKQLSQGPRSPSQPARICSPRALLADNQDVEGSSSCHIHLEGQRLLSKHQQSPQGASTCHLESKDVANEPGDDSHCTREISKGSTCLVEEPSGSTNLSSPNGSCTDQLCVDVKIEEMTSREDHLVNVCNRSVPGSPAASTSMKHDTVIFYDCDIVDDATAPDLDEPETCESNISVCSDSCLTAKTNETENNVGQLNSSGASEDPQKLLQEAADSEFGSLRANVNPEARGSAEIDNEQTSLNEPADLKDESSSATVVSQSGKICRIDVLEDAINEAKNNKKTLFSSMETVINMMKKAEDLETAADEAKEQAVKGGVEILAKVEELRKMLLHAKEANDMHAGEVYGEKAILATEARELQARLINLSNERTKSLAILDEMRQVLESRLAVAEEIMKAAEQDKLRKEESARKALSEQEIIMEKVVQESKRLQFEAEENSKLREFLMDRGQIVDVLQGEMAVICLDITSLKENFDERAPLSKSLSSSQTSCILALSGSSSKSLAPNLILGQGESVENPKMISPTPVDNLSGKSKSELSEDQEMIMSASSEDHKNSGDDDWALPKMISTSSLDNLSEKSTSEWSEERMNSMIDDWSLPQTMSTLHYDSLLEKSTSEGLGNSKNLLDDDWALL